MMSNHLHKPIIPNKKTLTLTLTVTAIMLLFDLQDLGRRNRAPGVTGPIQNLLGAKQPSS